jgi:hypothetical protein
MQDRPSNPKTSTPQSSPSPQPRLKLEPLPDRLEVSEQGPWKRSQFSPFDAWGTIGQLQRHVAALEDRMSKLIDRLNKCKDC